MLTLPHLNGFLVLFFSPYSWRAHFTERSCCWEGQPLPALCSPNFSHAGMKIKIKYLTVCLLLPLCCWTAQYIWNWEVTYSFNRHSKLMMLYACLQQIFPFNSHLASNRVRVNAKWNHGETHNPVSVQFCVKYFLKTECRFTQIGIGFFWAK